MLCLKAYRLQTLEKVVGLLMMISIDSKYSFLSKDKADKTLGNEMSKLIRLMPSEKIKLLVLRYLLLELILNVPYLP